MHVNIFIVECMPNSKALGRLPLHSHLAENKHVILLDAQVDPFQFCRNYFYVMIVKPFQTEIPQYKYDPEWCINIIHFNENLWTYILTEEDSI